MNIISEPTVRAVTELHTHVRQHDGSWLQNKYTKEEDVVHALDQFECTNASVIDKIMEWEERGDRIEFYVDGDEGKKSRLLGDFWVDFDGNAHSHYSQEASV